MTSRFVFNRMELAGSLGDLGTLLPLAIAMIVINGLHPAGLFLAVGLFYILSGLYYGVTVSVQPMKVIGAYSIATAMTASEIAASGFLLAIFLLVIGATGAIQALGKWIPKSVVRGVQLSTGTMLVAQGVRFMAGTSTFQAIRNMAEPFLTVQSLGPLPIGMLIGITGGLLTLLLLDNKKWPAGLVVVLSGFVIGALVGTHEGFEKMRLGLYWPAFLPFGIPSSADLTFACLALVLPQIPMTLGNAVIANADLSQEYFGEHAKKVTYGALCITMGLANLFTFFVGGMPLCHGAGGLAAHYRFGAKTAGSNLMIGSVFVLLALLFGKHTLAIAYLLPMSILGILLVFAGIQLALTIGDLENRKDLFVALIMMGITLAANLAIGFVVGLAIAYALKWEKLAV
jgi:SulP family sulfate permease